jgi:hypothetical protein
VTGSELEDLAETRTPISVWATLPDGREVVETVAVMRAVVNIDGRPVLVATAADGGEIRLPVTAAATVALVDAVAGRSL